MKIKAMGSAAMVAALILAVAPSGWAATVNVFFDDGSNVPGSSNTNVPYAAQPRRDATWDVSATAEPGLSGIGAAVMEVRMISIASASSREAAVASGLGMAVSDLNGAWLDGTEAFLLQLKFYSDLAKTTEITGVESTFKSVTSRISLGVNATNMAVNAYATSGAFSWQDNGPAGPSPEDFASLNGFFLWGTANDLNASDSSDTNLVAVGAGSITDYYTINSDGSVIFGGGDTFWLRRVNLNSSPDVAYQLGAVTFELERPVTVFLDNGSSVPGSSNTNTPFAYGSRDVMWDVDASAESNLAAVGAEVMEVRMVTFNVNGNSRAANSGGGNGLAIDTGGNDSWMDGSTGEAALFQLTFYEDAAKTTEITDLDITFKAVISRIDIPPDGTNLAISAYAGSGVVDLSTNDNIGVVSLDGLSLHITNESANVFAWDNDLVAASPDLTPQRVEGTGSVVFGPSDSFWLRRSNLSGGADDVYQLGAVIFTVAPAWQGSIAIDQLSGTNAVGVSWSATAGKTYRLESKTDLTATGWSTNTTLTGLGVSVTVTDAVDQAESFYRVVEE